VNRPHPDVLAYVPQQIIDFHTVKIYSVVCEVLFEGEMLF